MTYAIIATREFFGPETRRSLVRDEMDNGAVTFSSHKDAAEFLSEYDSGTYHLSYNESSRPTYSIRKVDSLPRYLFGQL